MGEDELAEGTVPSRGLQYATAHSNLTQRPIHHESLLGKRGSLLELWLPLSPPSPKGRGRVAGGVVGAVVGVVR